MKSKTKSGSGQHIKERHLAKLNEILKALGNYRISSIESVGKAIPVYKVIIEAGPSQRKTYYFKVQHKKPKDAVDAFYGEPVDPKEIDEVVTKAIKDVKRKVNDLISNGELNKNEVEKEVKNWEELNPFIAHAEDDENWYYLQREVEPLLGIDALHVGKTLSKIRDLFWEEIMNEFKKRGIVAQDLFPENRTRHNIPFDVDRIRRNPRFHRFTGKKERGRA